MTVFIQNISNKTLDVGAIFAADNNFNFKE